MTLFCKLIIMVTAILFAIAAPTDLRNSGNEIHNTTATLIRGTKPILVKDITSSRGGYFSGRATWFTGSWGSCGVHFDTNEMIVALNQAQMDGSSQCGKMVKISANLKTIEARIVDTCPSRYCPTGALDLSQAVFKKLAPLSKGVIQIQWQFV
ncbi:hypothetical protein BGX28_003982 [Mortierella sp. GBA30]|nr:hypothetical protein BGX28_003982 [Mortierella sp. GBA30]